MAKTPDELEAEKKALAARLARDPPPPPNLSSKKTETSGGTAAGRVRFLKAPERFAGTSATTSPSLDDLVGVGYTTITSGVATPQEIDAITKVWVEAGLAADRVAIAAIDLAMAYSDVGASTKSTLMGASQADSNIARAKLANLITQAGVTPRQFCNYYAAVVFNYRLKINLPPANWAKMGFKEAHKFAAFDFFDAVDNPAALQPSEWVRHPTDAERAAHSVAKWGALHREKLQNGNYISNLAEITHGQVGGTSNLPAMLPPPPGDT